MIAMPQWAFVNDDFRPFSEAAFPLEDRGTQFGDGVYEVARIYRGTMFGFADHVQRMLTGADLIAIEHNWSVENLRPVFTELIRRNEQQDGIVYWQLTRGTAPRNHVFPHGVAANFMAYTRDYPDLSASWENGIKVIIAKDIRWLMCHVKSVNLLPNVLAKDAAARQGAGEALFEREGLGVIEGGSSNLFIVKDGVLKTPPLSEHILPGITRNYVLQLAAAAGIPAEQSYFSRQELLAADEVFITSTGVEVMPVVKVDEAVIADGVPGPLTRTLQQRYEAMISEAAGGR